ncbi:Cocaine esterase [Vanrija pseudolonga]|uniref:Cocaine esterase n=1 Tax=Vanrija pseudolonga TaxID=143232 RepID=A0AAF1BG60_9TREE|nr:Cocaine esterase [Vanrija pseudolonga]
MATNVPVNSPTVLPQPKAGANTLHSTHDFGHMVLEKNLDIPLKDGQGVLRANLYKPKAPGRYPVLVTYGPYGKDIRYVDFHYPSFSEIPDEQKSEANSAWETPHPEYWTANGYAVLRVDERGIASSYGYLDTMSPQTAGDFYQVIEWAADQPWSTGRIGLLGISYYGGSQWRVAARKPKGLTCIVPWEGMTDYYRDRVRHGGIYSNEFIDYWWDNQVKPMQYGNGNKARRHFPPDWEGPLIGPECLEGSMNDEARNKMRCDQPKDNSEHRYLDEPYHDSRVYNLSDIEVPILSVANLGGILLHLRGNVVGYIEAGTKNKWLWFIAGRHDLPFYLPEHVKLQKSFLDAWLKDEDPDGWKLGPNAKIPAVNLLIRKGNPPYNTAEGDASFKSRVEKEWPLARTVYTPFYLTPEQTLSLSPSTKEGTFELEPLGKAKPIWFPFKFDKETEIAGHSTAKLVYSIKGAPGGTTPRDIDVFLTVRHIAPDGKEVLYTGTVGDPVPLAKGWLRGSLRKIDTTSPKNHEWLPYRQYRSTDVEYLKPDTKYELLVEIWPTAVVVEAGGQIVLEVATGDTQGSGIFGHTDPKDRSEADFGGINVLHVGGESGSWLKLPVV